MEHQISAQTGPGQLGSDRDTFLRVWRRVMPEPGPDCPIQIRPEPPAPALPLPQRTQTEPENVQAAPPGALAALEPQTVRRDFPTWQDVPCLGEEAMDQAEQLRQLLEGEQLLWRRWKGLERRSAGTSQRTLAALGEGCRRRSRRLSAALFLLTGVRFQSPQGGKAPRSFLGGIREQFLDTQRQGCSYQAAAEGCEDRCLRALCLDLADDCAAQAGQIRETLERLQR